MQIKLPKNAAFQTLSTDYVKTRVDELAQKINCPSNFLPGYKRTMGGYYIEIDKKGLFHYVVDDKGGETRKQTNKLDELLYWIFECATFEMASLEFKNNTNISLMQDQRRFRFKHQEDLLGMLNEKWKEKKVKEHQTILKDHPYKDSE